MPLTHRVIACLDISAGRVVKGKQFVSLRDMGDPVELAMRYEAEGADEIVFLDIGAGPEKRETIYDIAKATAERLFIPLTIGGGIRSAADVERALRSGADKVSVNSAAITHPELLTECARLFGSQCVVVSIDARRSRSGGWEVFTSGGRTATGREAVAWAKETASLGTGEILLTSIDRDGGHQGYDLELTRAVSEAVGVPVIASGGCGSAAHVSAVFREAGADAALLAGVLHDRTTTIRAIKGALSRDGILVRLVA